MNNRRRWLFAQQARWFTSQFDADAIAQRARIVADGGAVIDFMAMQSFIQGLKTLGLYDNLLACWDARFGVKKDGSNYVSKWYDISANNRDAAQSTGSAQPIWGSTVGHGGNEGITFANGDFLLFTPVVLFPCTIIVKLKINSNTADMNILGRWTNNAIGIRIFNNGKAALYREGIVDYLSTTVAIGTSDVTIAFTSDYASPSANFTVKAFIDGVLNKTATTNNGGSAPAESNGIARGSGHYYMDGVLTNILLIDEPLTQTQIQNISAS